MEIGICIIFSMIFISTVYGQKCPSYWYGYSVTSKCYRFMYLHMLSWQDARDICQSHGGDLLKIDSVSERNWVFGQINHLRNHSKIPADKWWVGLNNREYITTWEWADGSAIASNVVNWAPGEPNNKGGTERCGEINSGRFNDQECTDVNRFICSRDRGIPLACDSDHGWQTANAQCYKVYTAKASWYNARQRCDHDGGTLAKVSSLIEETVIHDFAVSYKQVLWIGLYSVQQPGNTLSWQWIDGSPLTSNYWHGTPHVDRQHLNSSCAGVSNTVSDINAWNPQPCSQTRAFVCKKPEGVCFPGWIGHSTYCYQFNAQYRLSFNSAADYCKNQGAELLRYTGVTTRLFINSYLQEMKDSGASDFWIGASDNNTDNGVYKWRNGQAVTYNWWAAPHNTPTNTAGKQDCTYVSTSDKNGKYRTTSNCAAQKAFVCLTPMGKSVKPIPKTPRPRYGCPSNWHQYQGQCYRLFDQAYDWVTARGKCQQTAGADLATIRTRGVLNFVNHYAAPGIQYWIGLNDRYQEGVYVWNDEQNPITFKVWQRGQPNNYKGTQNCCVMLNGVWSDYDCQLKKRYACSKSANSIVPPQPAPTQQVDWTVKCGPGWESNPVTSNCYMFVDEPLSWLDAVYQCKSFHGNLVAIESLEEQNYLAGRIQSMNSIGVWIGANDRGVEGGWKWQSGKPFAFLNWAGGQPSSNGQGTDCVIMFTSNAQWDDVSCIQRNGYVCEKTGKVPTTKPPKTTTQKVPAGMVLGCRNGWKPYANSCYYFSRSQVTWNDAKTRCRRSSANLVSIHGKNEQDFITGILHLWKPRTPREGVWIGLNDLQTESRFTWSDDTDVTYTRWNINEPNSWMNREEDCVEVYINGSNWNDQQCSTKLGGYICKAPKRPVSATQSPYQIGCPKYTIGYESHCYQIRPSPPSTWTAANQFCNRTFHGTLATVNDRFVQGFLSSQLLSRTGYYWLGLTDSSSPGSYSWASRDRVEYTNWHSTHTGKENVTCVAMRADQPIGLWENQDCGSKHSFICQFPRHGGFSTTPTTPTPYPNVPCPSGWTPYWDKCIYAFTGKSTRLNWMSARTFCQGLGGDLPSFHVSLNDSVLASFISVQDGRQQFWIGLNDRDTEAGYKWSDGSAVDYTNWADNEPNNYKGNEDCVVYDTNNNINKWNDMNCYSTQDYICSIRRGASLPATTVLPPPSRSAQCGSDPNWYFYNDHCYLLPPPSGVNATLNWYDANTYCNDRNSHLTSIHSIEENFFLNGIISQAGSLTSYWIGLNELNFNGYEWTDNTTVDYVEWHQGEPNDYFGAERCVTIYSNFGGRWNDYNCANKVGYICKKAVGGQLIIPAVIKYPPGGCANGFTRVPGGRNKCFYLNNNALNWTASRDQCRKFGKGYDIASIEDLFEQDFFMSIAYGKKTGFWIGLSDRISNNHFFWQDNAPLHYTHWDRGEPTSRRSTDNNRKNVENCVAIRLSKGHEGKWADVDCSHALSSVCQSKQDPNLPINSPQGNCRGGYTPYRQSCYMISNDAKSWSDAQAACQKDGGTLSSVNDIYESSFIYTIASSKNPYWIGLSDSKVPGLYGWVDGWPVKFTNWDRRQPSYNGGCVMVNKRDRWDDTACNKQLHYVCKITSVRPPATTPTPPGNCSDPTWIPNGDYCYYASVNHAQSWPEANYQCQKAGMDLVSVHSKAEMDFVLNLVTQAKVSDPQKKPNIWIGLTKGPDGSFGWSDNSALGFLYWNSGQPTGLGAHGQIEECVEFDRTTGKWNDISCFTSRGYVCKASKGQPTVPVALQQQSNGGVGSSGLTGGVIAGIVLGCVVVIIFIVLIIILVNCKGVVKVPKFIGNAGFDNKLYDLGGNTGKLDSDS